MINLIDHPREISTYTAKIENNQASTITKEIPYKHSSYMKQEREKFEPLLSQGFEENCHTIIKEPFP